MGLHEAINSSDEFQGTQADALGLRECFESATHEQAIFINERHEIGDCAERDKNGASSLRSKPSTRRVFSCTHGRL